MQIYYEVLLGCDKCGHSEYLDPENYLCNKCLIKGITADLQETESASYLDATFKASQIVKHTNRLKSLNLRLQEQIKAT